MTAAGAIETIGGVRVERGAKIPTWFRCGGAADRLARPRDEGELRACLASDPGLRVVGDGANLLVADGGVRELVVSLEGERFTRIEVDESSGLVVAGAGARLPRVINLCVRSGLGGLETLAGIPASVGGAAAMNAGGRFGSFADRVERVDAMDREGREVELTREQAGFGYRTSGLGELIVTAVAFRLERGDAADLRDRRDEIMRTKTASQPMRERSAGCCFKNPTLGEAIEGIGAAGERVSAGLLIDRAGCKGLMVGGARVSEVHANFVVTAPEATASDVVGLMVEVGHRVRARFGVTLEPEVVIWRSENAS